LFCAAVSIDSTGRGGFGFPGQFTLGEIDLFAAPFAHVGAIEFIGKNLGFLAARGTFAGKGFQVAEVLVTGAMLGCRHGILLGHDVSRLWGCRPPAKKVQAIFLAMSRP
jgi:hypothetical protein